MACVAVYRASALRRVFICSNVVVVCERRRASDTHGPRACLQRRPAPSTEGLPEEMKCGKYSCTKKRV
eukprot:4966081-Pleurochrysis_carterae.AAC.2